MSRSHPTARVSSISLASGMRDSSTYGSPSSSKGCRSGRHQAPSNRSSRLRYSPAKCLGTNVKTITGEPNPKHVSTSYVERQNLTMRMSIKRFARLSNGFSRKLENHAATVALYFMYYNFARIHQTLRTTPTQAASVTDKLWEIEDIVGLLDQ